MTPGRLAVANTAPTSCLDVVDSQTGINGLVAAPTDTTILTVPVNRTLVILGAVVRLTAIAGFVTVGSGGLYVTAPDDIFAAAALTGLDTTTEG